MICCVHTGHETHIMSELIRILQKNVQVIQKALSGTNLLWLEL